MKLGYSLPSNQGFEDPNDIVILAEKAEKLGFNSVWTSEHLFHSSYIADRLDNLPYYEPLSILCAVAMRTHKIRLGTTVIVLPWHDPPRLAKTVATLDLLNAVDHAKAIRLLLYRGEFYVFASPQHTE